MAVNAAAFALVAAAYPGASVRIRARSVRARVTAMPTGAVEPAAVLVTAEPALSSLLCSVRAACA